MINIIENMCHLVLLSLMSWKNDARCIASHSIVMIVVEPYWYKTDLIFIDQTRNDPNGIIWERNTFSFLDLQNEISITCKKKNSGK